MKDEEIRNFQCYHQDALDDNPDDWKDQSEQSDFRESSDEKAQNSLLLFKPNYQFFQGSIICIA